MKKILIISGAVVALLIVVALVLPFFIPMERYKSEISTQVKSATGRDFVIDGKLSLSLFPNIQVTAEKVTLSNVPQSMEQNMLSLDQLHISLKFWPLLHGVVAVDGFELVRPVIHLEVDKAGHGNWEFEGAKKAEEDNSGSNAAAKFMKDLTLGNVRLTDGDVTYKNAQTAAMYEIKAINSKMSLPHYDGPLAVAGDLQWKGQKVNVDFKTTSLKSLMDGQKTPITAKIAADPVNFSLDGAATKGENFTLDGDVKLDVPSIRKLSAWLAKPIDMPGSGLGPLNIAGHLVMADKHYAFDKATIRLDDIHGRGAMQLSMAAPRMKVSGNLDVDGLNLNPYLPPIDPNEPAHKEWSTKPMDFSGLKAADLAFIFRTKSLQYRKIMVGPSTLALDLDNGHLKANLKQMSLYGGSGAGSVDVDGAAAVPAMKVDFNLANVNAEPLLKDAGNYEKLSGKLKTSFSVTTRGKNQRDLVSALNGSGAFQFSDGTLKGVDLAAIAETIERISNGVQQGGAGMLQGLLSGDILGSLKSVGTMFGGKGDVNKSTKFTSLTATWKAHDGDVSNNDLSLIGPYVNQRALFKMTGKGDVLLPPQEINYEAEIRSFAKSEAGTGIGGKVRLTGPMADPTPCVVLGSLCIGKSTKPGDLLKMKLKGALPGLGGAQGEGTSPGTSPQDKLKDIFKGFHP